MSCPRPAGATCPARPMEPQPGASRPNWRSVCSGPLRGSGCTPGSQWAGNEAPSGPLSAVACGSVLGVRALHLALSEVVCSGQAYGPGRVLAAWRL